MNRIAILISCFVLVTASAAETAGLRVWNSDLHDASDGEQGGGAASLTICGARNGVFSGKVVLGGGAISGLKCTAGDLKQGPALIPASHIQIRYGQAWETSNTMNYPAGKDILLEAPPASSAGNLPIWVTVRVPKNAQPGTYQGTVSLQAQGLSVSIPLTLQVQDWTVPDTQDYRTWIELLQSPDTLSLEYETPLWSEKHWELIGKSLDLIGQTSSRVLYIPLICRTNYGNEQSMVRWIKKGPSTGSGQGANQYSYDFEVMEKYLDLAEKRMGKPKFVVFQAWELFLVPPPQKIINAGGGSTTGEGAWWAARQKLYEEGKGPPVTVLDPASGKTETVYLPRYDKPESKALWQPLWTELKQRMAKRGLEKTMLLGMMSDWRPSKDELTLFSELTGNLPWASCSHHTSWMDSPNPSWQGFPVGYSAVALSFLYVLNPAIDRCYGWKEPALHGIFWRFGGRFNAGSLSTIRQEAECNITGKQRGISHLGADFWPCIRNKTGKRNGCTTDRYTESHWHSLDVCSFMLAPGPTGPVSTSRLLVFNEGTQECEARIAIEKVLTDEALKAKLGPDLAKRAQEILDERQLCLWKAQGAVEEHLQTIGRIKDYRQYGYDFMNADRHAPKPWNTIEGNKWFAQSGWAQRTGKLFAVAGEVEKAVGK